MTEQQTTTKHEIYAPVVDTPLCYYREPGEPDPSLDSPHYKSSVLRHPKQPLVYLPQGITEVPGLQLGRDPPGERSTGSGRVYDTEGKPLRNTLVEIWQANSAGRYLHKWDRWPAPLDPNFSGAGRCVTDDEGRYRFTTIK